MKTIERWIFKIVIFHFLLLVFFQFVFQHIQIIKDLQRITYYEGVNQQKETPTRETWRNHP